MSEENYSEEVVQLINKLLGNEAELKAFVTDKFGEYDENNNTFIDKSELENLTKEMYLDIGLTEPSDSDIANSLKEFDVDKNGKLDSSEFLAYCKHHFQAILTKLTSK